MGLRPASLGSASHSRCRNPCRRRRRRPKRLSEQRRPTPAISVWLYERARSFRRHHNYRQHANRTKAAGPRLRHDPARAFLLERSAPPSWRPTCRTGLPHRPESCPILTSGRKVLEVVEHSMQRLEDWNAPNRRDGLAPSDSTKKVEPRRRPQLLLHDGSDTGASDCPGATSRRNVDGCSGRTLRSRL
jgi:hypothetical protein